MEVLADIVFSLSVMDFVPRLYSNRHFQVRGLTFPRLSPRYIKFYGDVLGVSGSLMC